MSRILAVPHRAPATMTLDHLIRALALLVLMTLMSAPFLGARHELPLPSVQQEFLAIELGLALLVLAVWTARRGASYGSLVMALPLFLAILILLQLVLHYPIRPVAAGLGLVYLLWSVLLTLAIRWLIHRVGRIVVTMIMAAGIASGSLALILTGLLNLTLPHSAAFDWLYRSGTCVVCGNLAQSNLFADYVWLGTVAVIYLGLRGVLPRSVGTLALFAQIGASFAAQSRSAYLYWAWGIVWLLLWLALGRRPGVLPDRSRAYRGSVHYWACSLIVIGLVVQGLLVLAGLPTGAGRVLQTINHGDSVRLALLNGAGYIFLEHPWFGAGYGTFRDAFPRDLLPAVFATGTHEQLLPEHSHNLIAELLVDFGAVGLLGFMLLAAVIGSRIHLRSASPETWFAVALLGILGMHSMLEYPLWYAQFLAILMFALALLETSAPAGKAPMHERGVPAAPSRGRPVMQLISLLVLASSICVHLLYVDYVSKRNPTPSLPRVHGPMADAHSTLSLHFPTTQAAIGMPPAGSRAL